MCCIATQPYAVLFALFFMPKDACSDGVNGHISFAHAVFTFRKRAGTFSADAQRPDLFEKVYIGLFTDDGAVEFFDVEDAPPRNHRRRTRSRSVDVMRGHVVVRNEGVAPEDRYAPEDAAWMAPAGSLPDGLQADEPLEFEKAISDVDELPEEDG